MKKHLKWFTFIEIIITISIVIVLSVVAVTSHSSLVDKSNNTKVVSDLTTIQNSIDSYKKETWKIPQAFWNLKYYKEDTTYAHDLNEAFATSWFITKNSIPTKYLNSTPTDPRTWQYYAIWLVKNTDYYEVSWVIKVNQTYESKVLWNWTWEDWPYNLIKEYNWPWFVFDKSTTAFPYNPEELLLNAKIRNFSWSVLINWTNYDENTILWIDLLNWDQILVWTWGSAEIYFSDWNYSVIWDSEKQTKITLANMSYKEDSNLFTSVKIALDFWSIWTKATKLWEKSEYEIYTTDTVAAVRWTVFWVRSWENETNVTLVRWEVEIKEIDNSLSQNIDELVKDINNETIKTKNINWENEVTKLEVLEWESPKTFNYYAENKENEEVTWSWVIENIPLEIKDKIINNAWEINLWMKLNILEIKNNKNERFIKLKLDNSLKKWEYVLINWIKYPNLIKKDLDYLIINKELLEQELQNISICNKNNCTSEIKIDLSNYLSYENDIEKCIWWFLFLENQATKECITNDLSWSWYSLLAYAPYDVAWDYSIYSNNKTKISWDVWYWITNNILDASAGILNTLFYSGWNLWTDYQNQIKSLINFNWKKWIFVNNWENKYLEYNLNKIWLELKENFAIEVWVRWWALKRQYWIYYIYKLWDIYLNLFNTWNTNTETHALYFWNNVWDQSISTNVLFKNNTWLTNLHLDQNIKNDSMYKITSIIDSNNWILKLEWDWVNLVNTRTLSWRTYIPERNTLFIWSSQEKQQQWNDMIDYVKIYKK